MSCIYLLLCIIIVNQTSVHCHISKYKSNSTSIPTTASRRQSKFLFDSIFRIGSGISNVFGEETADVEDYEDIYIEQCECGKLIICNLLCVAKKNKKKFQNSHFFQVRNMLWTLLNCTSHKSTYLYLSFCKVNI